MAGDGPFAQSDVMKALVLAAVSVVAGSSLAAFAAPQVSCGCAPPQAETLAQATVVALESLCVREHRRDIAVAAGFEYWGGFSEFEGADGALEVRPGRPCRLDYLGGRSGASEIEEGLTAWARHKGLAVRDGDDGVRIAEGSAGRLQWSVASPPARRIIWTVEAVYSPPSI